jgi:hypothetical protein
LLMSSSCGSHSYTAEVLAEYVFRVSKLALRIRPLGALAVAATGRMVAPSVVGLGILVCWVSAGLLCCCVGAVT